MNLPRLPPWPSRPPRSTAEPVDLCGSNHHSGPDFLCIGQQKSGTGWLFDQMNARRDVWMPPIKELNYFIGKCLKAKNRRTIEQDEGSLPHYPLPGDELRRTAFLERFARYDENASDLDWYRSLFDFKGQRISGDISPNYSKLRPDEIAGVARALPEARVILLLREPVDRLWSGLCMKMRQDRFAAEDMTEWSTLQHYVRRMGVQQHSFASRIWEDWSRSFPRDRIRYWFFDDIVAQPQTVVDEICAFLGIEPGPGFLPPNFNRKGNARKIVMPPEIRAHLREFFAPEYERCARIFGGRAIDWQAAAALPG